jgi:putative pyruvate formate lyase activating enzyme
VRQKVHDIAGGFRVEAARRHDQQCALCEHRCGVNRAAGERGPCKAGTVARVFRHRVEYGEEPELVPSHLFYLSGCDLRCAFCIAGADAFDPMRGVELTNEFFNDAVEWGKSRGARNVQWVGGEPTIHLPAILEAMRGCADLPPIVWKSDFHGTPEAFELLDGVVDTYVADFKFGNDACARRIAGVENYVQILTRNLKVAAAQTRLIVRHLLLPGHEECCYEPIVRWMADELPGVSFSIRDGYLPRWRAKHFAELARPLDRHAGHAANEFARKHRLMVIA